MRCLFFWPELPSGPRREDSPDDKATGLTWAGISQEHECLRRRKIISGKFLQTRTEFVCSSNTLCSRNPHLRLPHAVVQSCQLLKCGKILLWLLKTWFPGSVRHGYGSIGSTCISLLPLAVLNPRSLPGCCCYEVNENMVNPPKVPASHFLKAPFLPASTPLDATKWFQVPLRLVRGLILLIRKATFPEIAVVLSSPPSD